jgi:hypothetical protein
MLAGMLTMGQGRTGPRKDRAKEGQEAILNWNTENSRLANVENWVALFKFLVDSFGLLSGGQALVLLTA